MLRIRLLILLVIACLTGALQAQRLDQDLASLASLPQDSNRVMALNRISEALLRDYPDSAMAVAAQAMSLSRKVNFLPGQSQGRLNQARASIAQGDYADAAATLKICKADFAQLHDLRGQAECALAEGALALAQKSWITALAAGHEADSLLAADTLVHHGPDYLRGRVFQELGNQDYATQHFRTALRMAMASGDRRGRAIAAEALGGILLQQGAADSALAQFRTAFEAWKEAGDRIGQMVAFTGMGTASVRAGRPDAALTYLQDAIALAREDRARLREGNALVKLAEAEIKLGLPDSAQRRCFDALAILRKLQDPQPALDARIGIVQAALVRADYARAQRHGDSAIHIGDSLGLYRPLLTVNQLLSKGFQVQGDYRLALQYYQNAMAAKDSLQRTKERNLALAAEVQLADDAAFSGRQEAQATAQATAALQQELDRTKILLYAVGGALALCLIGGILLGLRARKRNQQQTNLLAQKDEEIEAADAELARLGGRLQASDFDYESVVAERTETLQDAVESLISENEGLQMFAYQSARDLQGPVQRLRELARKAQASGQVKDFVTSMDEVDAEATFMDRMLQKLMALQEIKHGFKEIAPVNIEEMILDLRPKMKELPGVKYPDLRFEDRLKRPVLVDKNLIRIILENLLENACVFRKDLRNDSPRIEVLLRKEDEDIHISVRDEGIGIPAAGRERLYDAFYRGTERSKGHGLGLYLVMRALREIGGRIAIESQEGAYTEVIIRFHEMES